MPPLILAQCHHAHAVLVLTSLDLHDFPVGVVEEAVLQFVCDAWSYRRWRSGTRIAHTLVSLVRFEDTPEDVLFRRREDHRREIVPRLHEEGC